MGRALFRPLFAFLLLAGFLARSSGLERLHQCPASAAAHGARHEGHEHGQHAVPGDRCECVGQSCTTAVAVPVERTGIAAPLSFHAAVTRPAAAVRSRAPASHLLPFAHGPPA